MVEKKNPVAVQIGQRVKQARKMAGYDTAAMLLQAVPGWSKSRLGNYEAGISLPSPDDIRCIADATGASACWIMFGSGPIRASGRDSQAIRHQNFTYIYEQQIKNKSQFNRFLKDTGLSGKKAEQLYRDPFLLLSEHLARKIEKQTRHAKGWMDEQHVESDPVCAAFPEDMRRVMEIFSNLPTEKRTMFLQIAEVFSQQN